MSNLVLPSATIGIIGGGQLGRMIAIEAKAMGYRVIVLDPTMDCPCAQVCDEQLIGDLNSYEMLEQLCRKSNLVTYEFENIDVHHIERLEKQYAIPQGSKALRLSQKRDQEKHFAKSLGIAVGYFQLVDTWEELLQAITTIGYPLLVKTNRFGYDGKGQVKLESQHDLEAKHELLRTILKQSCLVEEFITFDQEISVIYTRGYQNAAAFPIPNNIHEQGILKYSIVPAEISGQLQKEAIRITALLADELQYIGTMAVELFVRNGMIYFNEMAPRVHNTGHYTLDVCSKSQFRTHMEAICGYTLSPIIKYSDAVMVNILGKDIEDLYHYLTQGSNMQYNHYLYGKQKAEPYRKMGHLTLFGDHKATLIRQAKQLGGTKE